MDGNEDAEDEKDLDMSRLDEQIDDEEDDDDDEDEDEKENEEGISPPSAGKISFHMFLDLIIPILC